MDFTIEELVLNELLFNAMLIILEAYVGESFAIKNPNRFIRVHSKILKKLKPYNYIFLRELKNCGALDRTLGKLEKASVEQIIAFKKNKVFTIVFY